MLGVDIIINRSMMMSVFDRSEITDAVKRSSSTVLFCLPTRPIASVRAALARAISRSISSVAIPRDTVAAAMPAPKLPTPVTAARARRVLSPAERNLPERTELAAKKNVEIAAFVSGRPTSVPDFSVSTARASLKLQIASLRGYREYAPAQETAPGKANVRDNASRVPR